MRCRRSAAGEKEATIFDSGRLAVIVDVFRGEKNSSRMGQRRLGQVLVEGNLSIDGRNPAAIASDRDSIPVDICVPNDEVRVGQRIRRRGTDRDRRLGFRNRLGLRGWRFRRWRWRFGFRRRDWFQRADEYRRSSGFDVVDPVVVLS